MTASSTPANRSNKSRRLSIAGVTAAAAAALTFSLIPGHASAEGEGKVAAASTSTAPVAFKSTTGGSQAAPAHKSLTEQHTLAERVAEIHAKQDTKGKEKAQAEEKAAAKKKAAAKAKAKKRAAAKAKASRSADRKPAYANNLNGWIKEALSIMKKEKIPGSYEGLHRNIMRESSGNRGRSTTGTSTPRTASRRSACSR